MRTGRELRECVFRQGENLFGLVQPVLFQQRAPQHEAGVADLVQPVGARDRRLAVSEPLERMARVLFGLDRFASLQVHLGERGNHR